MKHTPEMLLESFRWAKGREAEGRLTVEEVPLSREAILAGVASGRSSAILMDSLDSMSSDVRVIEGHKVSFLYAERHLIRVVRYSFGALYGSIAVDREVRNFEQLSHDLAYKVFAPKNADYGDAFALCGVPGICVRILDKYQRLAKLAPELKNPGNPGITKLTGVSGQVGESVKDTLVDMANYAGMGIMLILNG